MRRRLSRTRSTAAAALVLLVVLAAGCGGTETVTSGSATEATSTTDTTGGAAPTCADVSAPAARTDESRSAPTAALDPATPTTLTFATSCGTFVVTLDPAASPKAAASFAELARSGFYDDTIFHRVVPDFVIQGGDPTQTGAGGPGYSTVDTPAAGTTYLRGTVAMAKTETEAAGAAGSQFFVVTATDAGLSPDYAVVGHVTSGLDVVEAIGALGDATTQQPSKPVVIDTVTVATG